MIRRKRLDGVNTYYNIDGFTDNLSKIGSGLDIQRILSPFGELHLRTMKGKKYEYCGPGTELQKRIARGDEGINRLDKVCKQHDIDYDHSQNLKDKHVADQKMIDTINKFDNKTLIERGVKNIIFAKKKLGLGLKSKNVRSQHSIKIGK